jgi:tRNA A37 methylthiotransferase MiaB
MIRERCELLRKISAAKNLAFRQRFVGRILPAISLAKEEEMGESVVLTENYIHARISGPAISPNRLIHIQIDEARQRETTATLCPCT